MNITPSGNMDLASRLHTRSNAPSYLERERNGVPDDSSGESESNFIRRKFQRTAEEPAGVSFENATFRKPSLPASATRDLERGASLSNRRKSVLRDTRVPSGPREFPSPGRRNISSSSGANFTPTSNPRAPLTAHANSETLPTDPPRTAPASSAAGLSRQPDRPSDSFSFLPDISFDDFQTSIQSYDGGGLQLADFSAVVGEGRRLLAGEGTSYAPAVDAMPLSVRSRIESRNRYGQEQLNPQTVSRTPSLGHRLAARQTGSGSGPAELSSKDLPRLPNTVPAPAPASVPGPSMATTTTAMRDRRKSSVPHSIAGAAATSVAVSKAPRKSVGPGFVSRLRKASGDGTADDAFSVSVRPGRTGSMATDRRTTMHVANVASADPPRSASLSTTTQPLRTARVSSMHATTSESVDLFTNAPIPKQSKTNDNRSHSPNSRRGGQPAAQSGRASGLGARTVSPTDAKRLQRMSMANVPPMPRPQAKAASAPPEDARIVPPTTRPPDFLRLAQPSPSLIPKKTGSTTPSSTRESLDGRVSHISGLVSKASLSSLANAASVGNPMSRLPTPRGRQNGQPTAPLQHSDASSETEHDEIVPPVPAIPKAYESPKDHMYGPYLKQSLNGIGTEASGLDPALELAAISAPFSTHQFGRASLDESAPSSPAKRVGEQARARHRRTLTSESTSGMFGATMATTAPRFPKSVRPPPDSSGRQNANLRPMRLPPLNIAPMTSHGASQPSNASLARPSQDIDTPDEFVTAQTPEPRRAPKTPSTPMTASKATFFRRQDERMNTIRSSSSHLNLRDAQGVDDGTILPWDSHDLPSTSGPPMPSVQGKQRSTVTPFSSGSLPKGSGEFSRARSGQNADVDREYAAIQNQRHRFARGRAQTGGTISSVNSNTPQTPSSLESPVTESLMVKDESEKKEKEVGGTGGLRRKLSLGWRRASSKNANHPANRSSPTHQDEHTGERERNRLTKKKSETMPPPKLPASATWSGDMFAASAGAPRPNVASTAATQSIPMAQTAVTKRISPAPDAQHDTNLMGGTKLTRVQSEQPRPVGVSQDLRSSSWSFLPASMAMRPAAGKRAALPEIGQLRSSGASESFVAGKKDKDDLAADEEMQRLSRKRKDVDAAARETEELKKRAVAVVPMRAEQVLHDSRLTGGSALNVFERGEIVDHEKEGVYFTGARAARKIVGALDPGHMTGSEAKDSKGGSNNFGYDDERGDYNIVLGDHLAYRYEVVDVLGKGSFGQVVRCIDHREGCVVAVKIIRNKKRFHQQALVEVGILGKLKEWDPDGVHATLSVTGSFYFRNHLCIVTPCLSINLYEFIRAHNFVGFQMPLVRRFGRQLLTCLTLLQAKRIIHCDLKPENILLCEARKADVKVIDFGSSCREEEKVYTYIQSRFYRSPEVILGSSYGLGIDMWSLGCILAELWTGYPLFPGENEQEQLACIMEIFGPPDRHLVERCTRKKLFFDSVGKPRVTVSSKGRRRRPSSKTLQQSLKTEDEAFIDFLTRCLRWDPDRRLQPSEAIEHPWITNQRMEPRPTISDDARRAARMRSAAAPAAPGGASSPVKRSANAFAQQQQQQLAGSTSVRDRSKPPAEGPQAATKTSAGGSSLNPPVARIPSSSPVKMPVQIPKDKDSVSRRHSVIATAGAAAVAGNKRASNGAILGHEPGGTPRLSSMPSSNSIAPQRLQSGNLAAIAARESMAGSLQGSSSATSSGAPVAAANIGSGRWRT